MYIRQAHSEDWPIGVWSHRAQPRTFAERRERGQMFAREYEVKMPMVFDTMDDAFNDVMVSWPLRMYVISPNGKVLYIEPQPKDGIENKTRLDNLLAFKRSYDETGGNIIKPEL